MLNYTEAARFEQSLRCKLRASGPLATIKHVSGRKPTQCDVTHIIDPASGKML